MIVRFLLLFYFGKATDTQVRYLRKCARESSTSKEDRQTNIHKTVVGKFTTWLLSLLAENCMVLSHMPARGDTGDYL